MKLVKKGLEFSKKLMVFASAMFAATWAVIVAAFFQGGEPPWELMEKLSWVYGAAVACYCCKAAYENGAKIGSSRKGKGGER